MQYKIAKKLFTIIKFRKYQWLDPLGGVNTSREPHLWCVQERSQTFVMEVGHPDPPYQMSTR